jgi:TRAP-type C4-dicarboxylate transport system permease small subunit
MLDKYVLACSIFIIIMVIESGYVALLARKDDKAAEDVEFATIIGLVVLVGAFHAAFALQVMWEKRKGKDFKSHNLDNWEELARIRLDDQKKVPISRDTLRNRPSAAVVPV